MRITNGMMQSDAVFNMNDALRQMDDLQRELASGKAVNRPSDDPARASDVMRLQSDLSRNNQFQRNTADGINWLETTDGVLGGLTDLLHRARQLALQAANADLPDDARQSLANEVQSLIDGVVQISQTTYAGRYIFGGTATNTPPVTVVGTTATYNGNTDNIKREIGSGLTESINITGDRVFTNAGGVLPGLFQLLTDMQAGNSAAITADVTLVDSGLDAVLTARSETGARANRLQAAQSWQTDAEINLTQLLSTTQDADVAKVIVKLTAAESTYRAALAVAGRVLPPSLVDFLR